MSLEAALRSAIETADRVIGVAGHRLTLEPPGAPLALDADKVRIAQVFANLLNNAVKYTAPVGRSRAAREGAEAVVTVSRRSYPETSDALSMPARG